MPRVNVVQKARRSPGSCETCHRVIEAGESYHNWSFRYGGKHVNCARHTPRQSQLTQGKLAAAYAAIEDAFDQVCEWGIPGEGEKFVFAGSGVVETDNLPAAEDLKSILDDCASALNEVAQEYRDASDAAPNFAEMNDARADALESSASGLEDVEFEEFEDWLESNPVEIEDGGGIPTEAEVAEKIDEWITAQREIAEEALNDAEVEG